MPRLASNGRREEMILRVLLRVKRSRAPSGTRGWSLFATFNDHSLSPALVASTVCSWEPDVGSGRDRPLQARGTEAEQKNLAPHEATISLPFNDSGMCRARGTNAAADFSTSGPAI